MTDTGRSPPQLKVRLEEDLKSWLKAQAALNRRTLTQEIVYRLDASRQQQEAKAQP